MYFLGELNWNRTKLESSVGEKDGERLKEVTRESSKPYDRNVLLNHLGCFMMSFVITKCKDKCQRN